MRIRLCRAFLLLIALLGLAALPASAGLRRWTPIGPGGGYINDLAVEPASPQVIWAAGALGLYRSEDSGNTWSQRVGGFPHSFQQVEVDPSRPGVVFAGGNQLVRSTDGGLTWTVLPLPSSISVLTVVPGNGGDATLYAGYPGEIFRSTDDGDTWSSFFQGTQIQEVVVDPHDPQTIYVASAAGVSKSVDGGATWHPVNFVTGGSELMNVRFLLLAPSEPQTLYVYDFFLRLFRSTDGGESWTRLPSTDLDPAVSYTAMAVDPTSSTTLYLAGPYALLVSTDGGDTWQAADGGQSGPPSSPLRATTIEIDPTRPQSLYIGSLQIGVGRSRDGGAHWRFGFQSGLWDAELFVRLHPTRPGVLYAFVGSGRGQSFVSTDGGQSWERFAAGLGARELTDVAFDPAAPANVLYVATPQSLFKSVDGGVTWRGVLGSGVRRLAATGPGRVLAAPVACGLLRTDDGGARWRQALPCNVDLPNIGRTTLVVDELVTEPGNPAQVYAAGRLTWGSGRSEPRLYVSRDGGVTWQERPAARRLAPDPSQPGTVYGIDPEGWLVRSTNSGRSWTWLSREVGVVVVDPHNPRILYGGTPTAIVRSTDGGLTWKRANAGIPNLTASTVGYLLADPFVDGRFYAVLSRGTLYEATFPGSAGPARFRATASATLIPSTAAERMPPA